MGRYNKNINNLFLLIIIVMSLLFGTVSGKQKVQLMISAAASLQVPLETIAALYQQDNPDVKLLLNFGSSGSLRQQIEQGAQVDIFFPAAAKDMDLVAEKQLVLSGTRKDLLRNSLVLIVSEQGEWIKTFSDLSSKRLSQIAVGHPESVPAGRYAREALTYLKLWTEVEGKLIFAKDVKQVLTWVATGNVDAGFVYHTDAKSVDNVKVVATAPEKSHTPIVYPVAVLKSSLFPEEAGRFIKYLTSTKANKVFVEHGFLINNQKSLKE
ncbi:MAG TPA: molybdate ABC transporter substrate-binding protein [Bacillota bacterium]|nr:molybdate ABC transporter substrate-binding protein [Bacillota bacterium]